MPDHWNDSFKRDVVQYLEDHKDDILAWMVHPGFGQFSAQPIHCLKSIIEGIRCDFNDDHLN